MPDKKKEKRPRCETCKATGTVYDKDNNLMLDCPMCKGKGHR
jgi:DnaJ-class molecular chaperone